MGSLEGRVAIVTGAGGGIGAACAKALSSAGAAVLVTDIVGENAEKVAGEITESGGRASSVAVDVAEESQVASMIDHAISTFGRLDILHNNAAATGASVNDHDLLEMDPGVWDLTMAVNLRGPMLGAKHAIPRMIASGGGVVINTSSGAGILAEPTRPAYGASKAGLNSLTRYIAVRYGKQGIRSVAVAPGITLGQPARDALESTEWLAMMRRHHLSTDLGRPEDIGHLVAFLASDEARFITGTVISIDGGIVAAVPYAAEMLERGTQMF